MTDTGTPLIHEKHQKKQKGQPFSSFSVSPLNRDSTIIGCIHAIQTQVCTQLVEFTEERRKENW